MACCILGAIAISQLLAVIHFIRSRRLLACGIAAAACAMLAGLAFVFLGKDDHAHHWSSHRNATVQSARYCGGNPDVRKPDARLAALDPSQI